VKAGNVMYRIYMLYWGSRIDLDTSVYLCAGTGEHDKRFTFFWKEWNKCQMPYLVAHGWGFFFILV